MRDLTAIGAYIFAGGFTVGVREYFDVLCHFEEGSYGVATVKRNLGLDVHEVLADWPRDEYAGVDLIYANPPCAAWSSMNISFYGGNDWRDHPALPCHANVHKLLERMRPTILITESVRGQYTKGRPLIDEISANAAKLGYSSYYVLVSGDNHGVPQRRKRFFLVLTRVKLQWEPSRVPIVTAGEILRQEFAEQHCYEPKETSHSRMWWCLVPGLEPGKRLAAAFTEAYPKYVDWYARRGKPVKGRPSFQCARIDPDGLCPTITGGCNAIHPWEDRYISVEESAALCGYPLNYVFEGRLAVQYAQIGQAVCPPTGEYAAMVAAKGIHRGMLINRSFTQELEVFRDRVKFEQKEMIT